MTTKWLPYGGGNLRRGLQVKDTGEIEWTFMRQGDVRRRSVFLNKYVPADRFNVSRNILTAKCLKRSVMGRYPVVLTPSGTGDATIEVDGASMDLTIGSPKTVKVAFRNVTNDYHGDHHDWKSNFTHRDVLRMLDTVNAIYSYQGNIRFTALGNVKKARDSKADYDRLRNRPVQRVNTDIFSYQLPEEFEDQTDDNADVTVFFVKDYKRPGKNPWATSYKNVILMEMGIDKKIFDLVLSHELGHFLGLRHPGSPKHRNLMNQTKVANSEYGGRHRYSSFLDKEQIQKIRNPCNWKNTDGHVCT